MTKTITIIGLILTIFIINPLQAYAGELTERLGQYPNWNSFPTVSKNYPDLFYPDWIAGTWDVTSILEEQVAPFAPEIMTPGFKKNNEYLHKKINFQVRFKPKSPTKFTLLALSSLRTNRQPIVADREFNGFSIGQAYLGKNGILGVKVDPQNPNRQITFLPENNKLISTITGRNQETPSQNKLVTTEITQQIFEGNSLNYLNQVETTTAYHLLSPNKIEAEQVTAIYLSPQDPDYFQTINRPVSLYRYHLELSRSQEQ